MEVIFFFYLVTNWVNKHYFVLFCQKKKKKKLFSRDYRPRRCQHCYVLITTSCAPTIPTAIMNYLLTI